MFLVPSSCDCNFSQRWPLHETKRFQVAEDVDARGKVKGHQYLVHFQGWNASWDRFVPEEFLLKDSPENR